MGCGISLTRSQFVTCLVLELIGKRAISIINGASIRQRCGCAGIRSGKAMKKAFLLLLFIPVCVSAQIYPYFPPPSTTYTPGTTLWSGLASGIGSTCVAYGVWGNINSSSAVPACTALSSYPVVAFPTLNQSTTGNAATATALATTPSQCSNQYATGIAASGNANCGAIPSSVFADLNANTPFTVAGTGCTPTIATETGNGAGPFTGTIQLASGPCTAVTITINGATGFTAASGFHCNAGDKSATSQFTGPPTNGALTQTAGGTIAATTYYVESTWVNANGETVGAVQTSLAVSANNVLNVAAPSNAPASATGWNVYVTTTSGSYTTAKQNTSAIALGTAWVEPTTGLISGAAIPSSNTTGNFIPGWIESASTTTTVTIPIPPAVAATDIVSVSCNYF